MATNEYGLDERYFRGEIERLLRDLGSYTPDDLARKLARMARTADETAALTELAGRQPDAWALVDGDGQTRLLHRTHEASLGAAGRWSDAYAGCTHAPLYRGLPPEDGAAC